MTAQIQFQYKLPSADSVWGIEALDALRHFEWAQTLYRELLSHRYFNRPVLLYYTPDAERSAIKTLRTLSRISQRSGQNVFSFLPGKVPLLSTMPAVKSGLFLVHRASRFLNLPEWLSVRLLHPSCKVVLTAPVDELEAIVAHRRVARMPVPAEEPGYCERKANEIIAKYLNQRINSNQHLQQLLSTVAEAGVAGIELPVDLLARHVRLEIDEIISLLQNWPLSNFVQISEPNEFENLTVSFRGQWLARSIASYAEIGEYPILFSMLGFVNPSKACHRSFLLNLLVALRAQGALHQSIWLAEEYHHQIVACEQHAAMRESLAWDLYFNHGLRKVLRIVLYLIQKTLRFAPPYRKPRFRRVHVFNRI